MLHGILGLVVGSGKVLGVSGTRNGGGVVGREVGGGSGFRG